MTADWKKDGYRGQFNDRCLTTAELLRMVGYQSYMVGKWHLTRNTAGPADESWPIGAASTASSAR